MDENADWLKRVESEMSLTAEDTNIPEVDVRTFQVFFLFNGWAFSTKTEIDNHKQITLWKISTKRVVVHAMVVVDDQ